MSAGIEALEPRRLLAFTGDGSGVFANPQPVGAIVTGVGTSTFSWGQGIQGSPPSSLTFTGSSFSVETGVAFSLGRLLYFNGRTETGTSATSVDLRPTTVFSSPAGIPAVQFSYPLALINTPNDPNPDEPDIVRLALPAYPSQTFSTVDGRTFTLEIVGFGEVTGSGTTTIDEFRVIEGGSAQAQLLARFIGTPSAPELISPVPGSAVGFGATFKFKAIDSSSQSLAYQIELQVGDGRKTYTMADVVASGSVAVATLPVESGTPALTETVIQSHPQFGTVNSSRFLEPSSGIPYGAGVWRVRAKNQSGVYGPWSENPITFGAGVDRLVMPTTNMWGAMKAAGAGFFIAPTWQGQSANTNAWRQLFEAKLHGIEDTAGYCLLNFKKDKGKPVFSGTEQMQRALNVLQQGVVNMIPTLRFMAIDVEFTLFNVRNRGKLVTSGDAVTLVKQAIAKLNDYTDTHELPRIPVIIYTSRDPWTFIFHAGHDSSFASRQGIPLWEARQVYNTDNSLLDANFVPFGGWTRRVGRQHFLGQTPQENPQQASHFGVRDIDLDVFDFARIPRATATAVLAQRDVESDVQAPAAFAGFRIPMFSRCPIERDEADILDDEAVFEV